MPLQEGRPAPTGVHRNPRRFETLAGELRAGQWSSPSAAARLRCGAAHRSALWLAGVAAAALLAIATLEPLAHPVQAPEPLAQLIAVTRRPLAAARGQRA